MTDTFGDVRDLLQQLPEEPWGGYGGTYVLSDIFPTKHRVLQELVPDADSVFEIGACFGHFLVTALDALERCVRVGWCDNETHTPGSNAGVVANLDRWRALSGRQVSGEWFDHLVKITTRSFDRWDVVHVDGEHTLHACLIDLGVALALRPRVILVDDTIAHQPVIEAVKLFSTYTGLEPVWHTTANGFVTLEVHT